MPCVTEGALQVVWRFAGRSPVLPHLEEALNDLRSIRRFGEVRLSSFL